MAEKCLVDERVEFEAFIEASIVFARAALHRFQTKHRLNKKWKDWWSSQCANSAVNFFRTHRDWILKEAPPRVGQRGFAASIGCLRPSYEPTRASEFYYFDDASTSATDTIANHLLDLEMLLNDADEIFLESTHVNALQ